ncbi:MAG: glycosyltransferase family 2 protein [Mycobacterium sp.]
MQPRVTAVVVVHDGADHLERTLDALAAQTRPADEIIVVQVASGPTTAEVVRAFGPHHIVSSGVSLSFGAAIAQAVRIKAPPESDSEWLWLLAQDSAPDPGALAALLATVEVSPSVAVAGPKQMDWYASDYIREFGETITATGATVALVENELDQGQHDIASDVLAVGTGGMFVRYTLWQQLGGFDAGLPVVDDALDFCIRARLAGHRIVVVPDARVFLAGDGVAGATGSRRASARRTRMRQNRRAQLHRRLVYAPVPAVPLHWLTLIPLAIVRSLLFLLRKQPGAVAGEFIAAFDAAFSGVRVLRARRSLARTKVLGWSALEELRMPPAQIRQRRAIERDQVRVRRDGKRQPVQFFSTGGAWTTAAMLVVGFALFLPLVGAPALGGGGLLPLADRPAALWTHLGTGWRDVGLGFAGGADPFSYQVAVLGSITFWSPSVIIPVLYLVSLPLAAMGAWFLATQFTGRAGLRAVAGIAYALAPPLMIALTDGRLAAVMAHLLLPWLFYAALRALRSWSAAATTGLLGAAVVACAPILAPALAAAWFVALCASRRRAARMIATALPTLVLFAPLVASQLFQRGNPLGLLADPGPVIAHAAGPTGQVLIGFPGTSLDSWSTLLAALSIETAPQLVVGLLLAPLAVLALAALFLRGWSKAAAALGIALAGLATAVVAGQVSVSLLGPDAVPVWPGTGLSLAWLGVVCAAIIGLNAVPRLAPAPAVVALLAAGLAVSPLAIAVLAGTAAVTPTAGRTLPAVVTAEALTQPRLGTLVMIGQPDGSLAVRLDRGAGRTLERVSTLESTAPTLSADDVRLAQLAANLSSTSGFDAGAQLAELGIGFVLLQTPQLAANPPSLTPVSVPEPELTPDVPGGTPSPVPSPAAATDAAADDAGLALGADSAELDKLVSRVTAALDGNAGLAPVGDTAFGLLWSHPLTTTDTPASILPGEGAPGATAMLWGQVIVFSLVFLLAVPTGPVRDFDLLAVNPRRGRRSAKRATKRSERDRRRAPNGAAAAADADEADEADTDHAPNTDRAEVRADLEPTAADDPAGDDSAADHPAGDDSAGDDSAGDDPAGDQDAQVRDDQ